MARLLPSIVTYRTDTEERDVETMSDSELRDILAESGYAVTAADSRARMLRTIEFIATHRPPHWAREH